MLEVSLWRYCIVLCNFLQSSAGRQMYWNLSLEALMFRINNPYYMNAILLSSKTFRFTYIYVSTYEMNFILYWNYKYIFNMLHFLLSSMTTIFSYMLLFQ